MSALGWILLFLGVFSGVLSLVTGLMNVQTYFETRGTSRGNSKPIKTSVFFVILLFLIAVALTPIAFVVGDPTLGGTSSSSAQNNINNVPRSTRTPEIPVMPSPSPSVSSARTPEIPVTPSPQLSLPSPTSIQSPQDLYRETIKGSPVINDSLSNQDTYNWSQDSECSFSNGTYHVAVPNWYFAWCIEQNTDFSDFVYQVQVTIVRGDYGGILFREDYSNALFYYFYVGQDGTYDLFLYQGIKGQKGLLLRSGSSSAILTGLNQPNLLGVLARGNDLYLYVNGQMVTSAQDSTVSSGLVGVIALPDKKATEVVCSNAQIWKL